jgi:YidC/Oxa1 family membrane protein insertase
MEQRNLLLAVAASIAILLGWQFLFEGPRLEKQRAAQEAAKLVQPAKQTPSAPNAVMPAAPTAPADGTTIPSAPSTGALRPGPSSGVQVPGAPMIGAPQVAKPPREAIIADQPRVLIDGKRLRGSIRLKGGQIDDLTMVDFRETTDPTSPQINLLSPPGSTHPYFAHFGWVTGDAGVRLPDDNTVWKADRSTLATNQALRLSWENGQGLRFIRTITLDDNFMFSVKQRVENSGPKAVTLYPYGLVSRTGTPKTLGFFILHEGLLGVINDQLKEIDYDDLQEAGKITAKSRGGWLGITDKYWLVALVPDQKAQIDTNFRHTLQNKEDKYQVDYLSGAVVVQSGGAGEVSNRLFAGAKEVTLLDAYEKDLGISRFDLAIDFGWFYFLTKPIFYVLKYFYELIGNFGLAILLLTVIIKLLFFPLANKSYTAMSRLKLLQPKMTKMRERFKDDKAKMNEAMMKLYKDEKVNPAAGCLPMVVQIPVFFALYKVLFVSIEMRHAPFYGWIQDLSAPDPTSLFTLFGMIPWTPPDFLMIGIWPVIMGASMFLQQKLNPAPADPMQAKIFMFLPLIFTFMLARFPAGLVIYWAWNNILSISQQYVIMKRMGVKIGG